MTGAEKPVTWSPEHLAVLQAGKWAVALYRENNWRVRLNLTGADLRGANLVGVDLTVANLSGADLSGAKLSGADLSLADLNGADLAGADLESASLGDAKLLCANLSGANLTGASLILAKLGGANLGGAKLNGAKLPDANLSSANITGAHLTGADLRGANFTGSDLTFASLSGANLSRAKLGGANLTNASFGNANLSYTTGALFDGNDLATTKLHVAAYPWLTLRRQYSGPMVLLHALILLLFFSPFVARGALHLAGTRTVRVAQAAADRTLRVAEAAAKEAVRHVPGVPADVADRLSLADLSVDVADQLNMRQAPLWAVMLQWDRGPMLCALVLALIAYAGVRFFLVWRVAPMREEEDRTKHAPHLADYRRLLKPHRVAQVLFWVSALSTLWHAWDWLAQDVLVSRSPI